MKRHRKAALIACLILTALVILILSLAIWKNQINPMQYIEQRLNDTNPDLDREIIQVIQDDKIVIFYRMNGTAVQCAVLQKSISGYRLLGTSGDLPANKQHIYQLPEENPEDIEEQRISSDLDRGKAGKICWGILYNHAISNVSISNHDAVIIDVKGIKLWFYFGDQNTDVRKAIFTR